MCLSKIVYVGEDAYEEINIGDALSLLGYDIVMAELEAQSGISIPVDADYYISFIWVR